VQKQKFSKWRMLVISKCLYLLPATPGLLLQEKFENYGLNHLKSVYFYGKNEIFRNFFERLGNILVTFGQFFLEFSIFLMARPIIRL